MILADCMFSQVRSYAVGTIHSRIKLIYTVVPIFYEIGIWHQHNAYFCTLDTFITIGAIHLHKYLTLLHVGGLLNLKQQERRHLSIILSART